MSGEWIKMRVNLWRDPAVIMIAEALHMSADEVVGKLHRLWSWADESTTDGKVRGVTSKWIDQFLQRKGFADAMSNAGWLAVNGSSITFPGFDRHNGATAKARALGCNRGQSFRKRNGSIVTDVTDDALHKRDESVTREEKRRNKVKPTRANPGGFDAFWMAYPKRKSKGDAERAWAKIKPDGDLVGKIIAALERAKASPDWQREDGRYIPHPATWLNGKGWEDDYGVGSVEPELL